MVFLPLERVLTSRQLYTAEGGAGERAWQCSTASQAGWALLTPAARLFTFAGLDLASLAGAVLAGDWEAARQEQANLQVRHCSTTQHCKCFTANCRRVAVTLLASVRRC